jgi:hypothetical protein
MKHQLLCILLLQSPAIRFTPPQASAQKPQRCIAAIGAMLSLLLLIIK